MARAAVLGRLTWRLADVRQVVTETPRVASLVLRVPDWPGHAAGQHVDVRLTAEDGYQAQRSYSIASAPDGEELAITVERLADGEVSSYLAGELRAGDQLELRGPIGGYFVWESAQGGPLLMLAGGSGVVPMMAMIRHLAGSKAGVEARLLYSSRTFDDIIYREELERLAGGAEGLQVFHTLTRSRPPGWEGFARRLDRDMLEEVAWPAARRPLAYICGPTAFVESAASLLVELGHEPARIKTERFGPTGG